MRTGTHLCSNYLQLRSKYSLPLINNGHAFANMLKSNETVWSL